MELLLGLKKPGEISSTCYYQDPLDFLTDPSQGQSYKTFWGGQYLQNFVQLSKPNRSFFFE